jgi:hypothetical protein
LVEISKKNIARFGIKDGRPTLLPTSRGATTKRAPTLQELSARAERQAKQDRRGARYVAQDEWYVEWLGVLLAELGGRFSSIGNAAPGDVYAIDRRRLSGYVVMVLRTREGDRPIARLEWRPGWGAMNVCYPVDIKAWGSVPRDLVVGLAPTPFYDHRWKTRSQRLSREMIMATPRAIGFFLRRGDIKGR